MQKDLILKVSNFFEIFFTEVTASMNVTETHEFKQEFKTINDIEGWITDQIWYRK